MGEMLTNIESCIINNGWVSERFKLSRGVQQGCPLSPYLFIICAEILGNAIRYEKKIKGITIKNKEHKINQYADDTCLTLTAEAETLSSTLNIFQELKKISGLKLNLEKTEIFRVGSLRNKQITIDTGQNITWTNGPITYLGIRLQNDVKELIRNNYELSIKKMKTILNIWKSRDLSLYGKITIVKTLAISQLTYLWNVLPNPTQNVIKEIETIIHKFIWSDKKDKIKIYILKVN
jgi:hypothetical protein